jgi:DNA-binding NarL/FixJ family response regulator
VTSATGPTGAPGPTGPAGASGPADVARPARSIRVVVADDHTLFREGVRQLLQTRADIEVVGEGATGDEAMSLVRLHRPDVLLLDVEMPGPGVTAVVDSLLRTHPDVAVVVLTMHHTTGLVHELVDRGVTGYLSKSVRRDELIAAVESAARQRTDNVVVSLPRGMMQGLNQVTPEKMLSPRETEVVQLLADALSNAQIATRLHISQGTVKRHLTNIYAKLDATSRVDAIRRAAAAGVIPGL